MPKKKSKKLSAKKKAAKKKKASSEEVSAQEFLPAVSMSLAEDVCKNFEVLLRDVEDNALKERLRQLYDQVAQVEPFQLKLFIASHIQWKLGAVNKMESVIDRVLNELCKDKRIEYAETKDLASLLSCVTKAKQSEEENLKDKLADTISPPIAATPNGTDFDLDPAAMEKIKALPKEERQKLAAVTAKLTERVRDIIKEVDSAK